MRERHKMQLFDWVIAAGLLAVGFYLGLAVGALLQLDGFAFWFTIIYVFIPFGFVFLFIYFMDDLADRIFSGARKPAHLKHTQKRKPLALLLSLPIGLVVGVIGSQVGLTEFFL